MKDTHLTQDERYQIAILAKAGHDQSDIASDIASVMSRHSREMKRHRGARGYRPKQAHEFPQARMRACGNGPRVTAETSMLDVKLGQTWRPEQVSGYLKVNGQTPVSHESIYQRIYADKRAGGALHRTLRCQKARRKRYGGRERRGTIPNQVSIDLRPAIVADRARFGDWAADSKLLLRSSFESVSGRCFLGAPRERAYERPDSPVLPKEDVLRFHYP
jgi:IS30 family transposase